MTAPTSEPPRRRRRPGVVALVVVLLVLGGLVVADRVTEGVAEDVAADRLQSRLDLAEPPLVEFGGFPFLTQLATRRFTEVELATGQVRIPVLETEVELTEPQVTLREVSAPAGEQWLAASGAGSALVSYAILSELTGLRLESAGEGKVALDFDIPLGQTMISGTATGIPVVDAQEQTLTLTEVQVTLASDSDGDPAAAEAAGRLVVQPVPLPELPYGLRLTGLEVRDDGVRAALDGENLPIPGP
jgi:LmeA-like phospholipid-binding